MVANPQMGNERAVPCAQVLIVRQLKRQRAAFEAVEHFKRQPRRARQVAEGFTRHGAQGVVDGVHQEVSSIGGSGLR